MNYFQKIANPRRALWVMAIALAIGVSCHGGDSDTTPAGGSLAQVEMGASSGTVHSGDAINIDIKGRNLGFSVLHSVRIHVTLASPLVVDRVDVTGGTGTATFSNSAGATVDYSFPTIDKNSQSTGTIHVHGTLASGQTSVSAHVTAEMTSDEVHSGDAVASINLVIQQ
ncbi:MAG: hypothetical protein ABI609_04850 [Acidobacteriota bacterium]